MQPAQARVWVHIEAPKGTVLEQAEMNDDGWRTVCAAPCDRYLPTAFAYRVNGDWIVASGDFTLDTSLGREQLAVDTAHVVPRVLGSMAMVVGVVVTGVGAFFTILFGGIWADVGFAPYNGQGINLPALVGIGGAMVGIGAVPLIGGILLVRRGTTVTRDPADVKQAALTTPWTSAASWTGVPEQRMAPAMTGIPLLGGRF